MQAEKSLVFDDASCQHSLVTTIDVQVQIHTFSVVAGPQASNATCASTSLNEVSLSYEVGALAQAVVSASTESMAMACVDEAPALSPALHSCHASFLRVSRIDAVRPFDQRAALYEAVEPTTTPLITPPLMTTREMPVVVDISQGSRPPTPNATGIARQRSTGRRPPMCQNHRRSRIGFASVMPCPGALRRVQVNSLYNKPMRYAHPQIGPP